MTDIPSMSAIASVVPNRCFTRQTLTSLAYLCQSIFIQAIVVVIGFSIPLKLSMVLVWILYAMISGTTAMGFWVIAHECGHGAFSNNRRLETVIGYLLHTILLVPYFSWQRSHSIHHRFTNHITDGETHVPLVIGANGISEQAGGDEEIAYSQSIGKTTFGVLQLILHLLLGWPAYLIAGKTSGPKYGLSNHFWPRAPFSKTMWPGNWSKKVWMSDFGIGIFLCVLFYWGWNFGIMSVVTIYFAPLLVVNCWLVVYTWLHHTDTDVPHLSGSDFSFMRGAFLSIDRPYGKILNFLHHHIGSTHVIHHIAPSVPHYHAKEATRAIKEAFPKIYLFNPTPIHRALWMIASNCVAVKAEKGSFRYLWQKP